MVIFRIFYEDLLDFRQLYICCEGHVVAQWCNDHHSATFCSVQLQATSRLADKLEKLLSRPVVPSMCSGVSAVKSHLCLVVGLLDGVEEVGMQRVATVS